ncbi:hypothetical protein CDL12_00482 [Handroanthus impetiginosus]|uniref:Uncharacterized protein n=1 Tax=Handroanthus impetiginosus TaxID=429701 RepID=A0A2G9IAH8_9LAMI|nr:hypothetical protein CDL12_00482 [Handroanthus impetiginosus]
MLLELEDEDEPIIKKKSSSSTSGNTKISTKNQTKLIKPSSTQSKNQTKLIKATTGSSKNQTKLIKATTGSSKNQTKLNKVLSSSAKNQTKLNKVLSGSDKNQTKLIKQTSGSAKNQTKLLKKTSSVSLKDSSETTLKSQIKKLDSTLKSSSNSTTKSASFSTKKASDLSKQSTSKSKTKAQIQNDANQSKSKSPDKTQSKKPPKLPSWIDDEEEEDLVSEFRDLPSKFQETFVPDLEIISKTSKVYLTKYNKEFTKGFKPYVGSKYAATIGSIVSFAFIIIPLILVSLIFNRITAYFSLQKLLIFIQIYLAIYFTILCISSLVTGLEPLRFFYSTSQSTYVCVQVLQTLAYVLYLLLLLMYLVLVFSTETRLASKLLGLAQTFVGFAVGLHYYITVFHRAVLRQPPKTGWKVHALYATCFVVICLLGRIDRRKKAYLEDGGQEGKRS